jgi:K+-sensing histidine kinase KdpD
VSEILPGDPKMELAQRKNFLGIITKETGWLSRLISQVLDPAKIESGAAQWQESSANMKKLIADTLTGMSRLFRENNIQLGVDLPERRPAAAATGFDRIIQTL